MGTRCEWREQRLQCRHSLVGTKGQLASNYNKYVLALEAFAKDFQPPEKSIKPSVGHHKEWTEACKGNGTPLCNFDYAGRLAEAVLLGNVAYRAEQAIDWNAEKGPPAVRKPTRSCHESSARAGSCQSDVLVASPLQGWCLGSAGAI